MVRKFGNEENLEKLLQRQIEATEKSTEALNRLADELARQRENEAPPLIIAPTVSADVLDFFGIAGEDELIGP